MVDNQEFFREKRATAVLKHGILSRYAPVFASKAGLKTNRRVVFLDGYAGPGHYGDEESTPGSPLLLAKSADFVQKFREVTCFFIESDAAHFANLKQVLAQRNSPHLRPIHGELDQHLATVLTAAKEMALLAFLDPFGTALDRERLVRDLLGRSWPTEVMLHFSISTVARTGGIVRKIGREGRKPTPAETATLANLDRFLGGAWWQQEFSRVGNDDDLNTATTVAEAVADAFCRRVKEETGHHSLSMPVRLRPQHSPRYLMVLFTRHPEGIWQFADALGKSAVEWHGAWRATETSRLRSRQEQDTLFDALPDLEFDPEAYKRENLNVWVAEIKQNIVALLSKRSEVRLRDYTSEVYGATLGSAWISHVKKAVKELYRGGLINNDGVDRDRGRDRFDLRPTRLVIPQ